MCCSCFAWGLITWLWDDIISSLACNHIHMSLFLFVPSSYPCYISLSSCHFIPHPNVFDYRMNTTFSIWLHIHLNDGTALYSSSAVCVSLLILDYKMNNTSSITLPHVSKESKETIMKREVSPIKMLDLWIMAVLQRNNNPTALCSVCLLWDKWLVLWLSQANCVVSAISDTKQNTLSTDLHYAL